MMKNLETGIVALNTSEIYRIGFWGHGKNPIHIKHVYATNKNPYDISGIQETPDQPEHDGCVYDLMGCKVAESVATAELSPGLYVAGGKKFIVKH